MNPKLDTFSRILLKAFAARLEPSPQYINIFQLKSMDPMNTALNQIDSYRKYKVNQKDKIINFLFIQNKSKTSIKVKDKN